ncbi:MAG: ComF family protein [Patescibacteria group bacterium]
MLPILIKIKNLALNIVFPRICIACRKNIENSNELICDDCFDLIKINNTLYCPVCRNRLAENKRICSHRRKNQPYLYLLAAAGNYDDQILRNLIHYFKYKNFQELAPVLGKLLLNYIGAANLNFKNFSVMPIPLYKSREKMRGFNQSKLLAEFISVNLNLELASALERIKDAQPQAILKGEESRVENIKNCFKIRNNTSLKGKNILLIDDVYTSGATIDEAVKILKENGVRRVIALVIARA